MRKEMCSRCSEFIIHEDGWIVFHICPAGSTYLDVIQGEIVEDTKEIEQ